MKTAGGTLVSGTRSAGLPARQIAASRRVRRAQPAARRCTVRRGSLGRTGGHGWGEPKPALRRV